MLLVALVLISRAFRKKNLGETVQQEERSYDASWQKVTGLVRGRETPT